MIFKVGDLVKVTLPDGTSDNGEITSITHCWYFSGSKDEFGVKLQSTKNIIYVEESSLSESADTLWSRFAPDCVCGADKTHSPRKPPGHSYWCEKGKWQDLWK